MYVCVFVCHSGACVCVCMGTCMWFRVKKIEEVIISKALCLCHVCAYCAGSGVNVCQHQDHGNAKWAEALNKEESLSLTLE